jgi:hypothetical protein
MKTKIAVFLSFFAVLVFAASLQRTMIVDNQYTSGSTTNQTFTNFSVLAQSSTPVFCVSIVATSAHNSAVSFTTEKSYDTTNWYALTNFVMTARTNELVHTNIELNLGLYPYTRLAAITNAGANPIRVRFELISR